MRSRWAKILVFALCLVPLARMGWRAWNQDLTANPVEYLTHFTGDWTIRLLVITLSITPLRRVLGLPDLVRFRRMTGLFAFFYGCLHFSVYFWVDKDFQFKEMIEDIGKRPFILAGFTAFVCMIPLALTSTAGWIRRLGGKRWQRLHRLIYVSAIAAVVHYYWLVKSDTRLPVFYGSMVALLLLYRVVNAAGSRRGELPAAARPSKESAGAR